MKFLKTVFKDILYVSKVTGTQKKKILIGISVIFSQLSVITDVFLIGLFAFLIAGQKTNIEIVDNLSDFFDENRILILFLVFFRFIFLFLQSYILRRIELTVTNNLKEYILKHIFEKRTYTTSDAYFYINELSGHIGYFYSNVAAFINNMLNVIVFSFYLVNSNLEVLFIFGIGLAILMFPLKVVIKKSRDYVDKSYYALRDSMSGIERIVENLFLIKILKKEEEEISKFATTLDLVKSHLLNNNNFGVINGYLPSFLTLIILASILIFSSSIKLTLDFIGVTLKLFNSITGVTTTFSKIVNSHVHIGKFKELNFDKNNPGKDNFLLVNSDSVLLKNVHFKYQNSTDDIFNGIDIEFKKGKHTILTGENGTGKSTLLGLIAGIYYPQRGKVLTHSIKYGYVSAQPFIFRDSLLNNIMYGNEQKNVSTSEILNLLKEFNTFKKEEEYVLDKIVSNKTLSSGQMQKIGFIRILLSKPEIILLDESTSNLDTESKGLVFKKLKKNNTTIINSTHDPKNFDFVDHHYEIAINNQRREVKKVF
ncbi:ABC transporter ATP-binding protein/permease [Candidatus Actinomarina sp.]|nr:ABC transporter ATP-binding protein/permease [Candidatus Actinomarina sp.]